MMGTVELSETEMLEMRYRPLGLTREPFMYHWTWSGGGYDITCTVRVVPPSLFTTSKRTTTIPATRSVMNMKVCSLFEHTPYTMPSDFTCYQIALHVHGGDKY